MPHYLKQTCLLYFTSTSLHSEVLHWKCSQGSMSHFIDSSGFGSPQWLSLTVAALSSPPLLSQRFFQRHTISLFIQPSQQRLSHLPHSFVCHSYRQFSTWHGWKRSWWFGIRIAETIGNVLRWAISPYNYPLTFDYSSSPQTLSHIPSIPLVHTHSPGLHGCLVSGLVAGLHDVMSINSICPLG